MQILLFIHLYLWASSKLIRNLIRKLRVRILCLRTRTFVRISSTNQSHSFCKRINFGGWRSNLNKPRNIQDLFLDSGVSSLLVLRLSKFCVSSSGATFFVRDLLMELKYFASYNQYFLLLFPSSNELNRTSKYSSANSIIIVHIHTRKVFLCV